MAICHDICRDKCIFCNYCEKFIHLKCSKLSRGQIRAQSHTYMCQICLKGSLPVDMVSKTDKKSPTNVSTPVSLNSKRLNREGDSLSPESEKGCGLCIECEMIV